MKKLMFVTLIATMMLGTTGLSLAQGDWHGGIRDRINVAYERIERGVERGSLTRHEAHRLRNELHHIQNKIGQMRRDGYLDPRERDIIHRNLDRLDREITMEKRDRNRRY